MISTFGVFIDANVLYGARLRSLVMYLAQTGIFRAHWSEEVHDEWMGAVLRTRADLKKSDLMPIRSCMDRSVPGGLVTGYSHLIPSINLSDLNDRHVVAAAATARCSAIMTFNLADFPIQELSKFGLHAVHPDTFLLDAADIDPRAFVDAVREDREHYKKPVKNADVYVAEILKAGCPETASFLNGVRILWS